MWCAPAFSAMPSIRPSTCAGTPESIFSGGVPSRSGHWARTRSWLPPMPPEVTITAWALSSKAPATSRLLAVPRSAALGSSTSPVTVSSAPAVRESPVTRWRKRSWTSPLATPSRTLRSKGATTPGPVPQVMWKRGTELPWPVAS